MGQRNSFSESDDKTILQMRKSGAKFKEIGQAISRTEQSVFQRFNRLKKAKKVRHFRKNNAGVSTELVASENKEAAKSRPMFALVGERAEIAQTLRELFS